MTPDQSAFTRAILSPEHPSPPGLSDPKGRPAGKRFDVYRNNVAVSLTDALETAFPVVRKLLGAENFRSIAGVHLRAHPPRTPLMMFYGADMPGFLESFSPVQKWGYLPDVARLELALRHAYHAADTEPLDPERLQTLPPERLMAARVRIAPAASVIRSRWPVHAIWRFNMIEDAPKPEMRAEDVLVHRAELDPDVTLLAPGAAAFILALQAGRRFGEAVDAGIADAAEFDLTTALGTLLASGAMTDLEETP
jgi:hypothetical protein